jgi:hypothetical protein
MLDPRIYRAGLVVAALGLIVLAFSLANQPAGSRSTLAPGAFDGQTAYTSMQTLYAKYPSRPPGSSADDRLGHAVAGTLGSSQYGFSVTRERFTARTVHGTRRLTDVVATRPGTEPGSIVIIAARDGAASQGVAGLSGTATLLELGSDLSGETLQRTVVLASVSGSGGSAGVRHLVSTLPGPLDAVVVLGDLAAADHRQPIVIPWSDTNKLASPALVNTVALALASQHAAHAAAPGTLAQLAHLAFPFTISGQGPFAGVGVSAVALSLSGERGASSSSPIDSQAVFTKTGRSVLDTVSALDSAATVPAPSSFVLFDGKVVPGWAIALFVLTLILPVVVTTIDACARAKRRGYPLLRSLIAVLGTALPFIAAALVVLIGRLVGLISAAPPGPTPAGAVSLGAGGIAVLVAAGVVALAMVALVRGPYRAVDRQPAAKESRDSRARTVDRRGDGTAAMMLAVLCVVTLVIWLQNPYAAALLVPALHLWLWAIDSDLRLRLPARLLMVAAGAVPVVLLVVYYGFSLHFTPIGLIWEAALLVAGHAVSLVTLVLWSFVLGCMATAVTVVVMAARRPLPVATGTKAVASVRGPVGYAGPGSLGATKSTVRR